jgi:hypothetical protein
MGERMSGGADSGRRRAHPARTTAGPHGADTGVEALLAAALGTGVSADADEGERRAVAAFRAARDAGAHRSARTRRRDDWRPRGRRHASLSLKATLSVLAASLTLGGVAVAAIGSGGSSSGSAADARPRQAASPGGKREAAPSVTTSPAASAPSASPADRDRPVTAADTEAQCRAYEDVEGRGKAMDATAWQRLVTAAGGERNVAAYCAARKGEERSAEKAPQATERAPEVTERAPEGPERAPRATENAPQTAEKPSKDQGRNE